MVGRLEEGEDVIGYFHLEAVHGVDYDVFGSHTAELSLVLGQADIVNFHLAWGFLLVALLVLVEVEGVDGVALEQVEDIDPSIGFHSNQQRP